MAGNSIRFNRTNFERIIKENKMPDGTLVLEQGKFERSLTDSEVDNFYARVKQLKDTTISINFFIYYTSPKDDKRKKFPIGRYSTVLSAESARAKAKELLATILIQKEDLVVESVDEVILGTLFNDFLNYKRVFKGVRDSTLKQDKSLYENHVKAALGSKDIYKVQDKEVEKLIIAIKDKGFERQADKVLILIHSFYVWMNEVRRLKVSKPAPYLKAKPTNKKVKGISPYHLKFLPLAMDQLGSDWKDLFLLALMTAARQSNLLTMKWSELNLEEGVWSVSDEKMKNGEPMRKSLSTQALVILSRRHQLAQRQMIDSDYVFYSTKSETGHIVNPHKAWAKIKDLVTCYSLQDTLKRRGIVFQNLWHLPSDKLVKHLLTQARQHYIDLDGVVFDHKFHDLRATAITQYVMSGANAPQVQALSGHKTAAMVARYYTPSDEEKARVENLASDNLLDMMGTIDKR